MQSARPLAAQSTPDTTAKRQPHKASVETALASSIAFLFLPGRSILALMPIWAVLCGACMAYVQTGAPTGVQPPTLLTLLLAVFLMGVLWSTWRALLVDVDWADVFGQYPLPSPELISGLPYTTPWSPIGRFVSRSSQFRRWSNTAPLRVRSAWYTLFVLPALALALSALAGWQWIVASLAALALSLIEWRISRRGQPHTALRAGMQVGLSWMAGHVTLSPLTWTAIAFACCYAIAYQGALGLARASLEPTRRARPLLFLYGGQTAALCLLAVLDRPFTAAFAGFLLAPQWLLLAGLGTGRVPSDAEYTTHSTAHRLAHSWYLQRALPICMIAMLAAAWAPR